MSGYTWRGGAGGWSQPGDWILGNAVAGTAPGPLDSVAIGGGAVVTGPGAAAAASLLGSVGFQGTLQLGSASAGGSLLAEAGADIRIAQTLSIAAGVTVDASSCVEVGANPVAWGGWIKVFAGGILSGSGTITANTAVYGTILANGMVFGGLLGGAGQVVLGPGGASVGTVFADTTLAFAAPGTLTIVGTIVGTIAGGASAMAGTLAGFALGDGIDLAHSLLGSAAIGAGGLVLRDMAGGIVGTIALQNAAALAGASVAVRADGSGGSLVSLVASPGSARALTWVGSASGLWSDPAAWQSGGLAAGFSPGSLDSVAIAAPAPILLTGPGAAASASLSGSVTLAGAYRFGSLAAGTLGAQGATVAVATTLSVTGGISLDGASCIEVGSSPVAWGGWLKVFADGTLSGSGTIAANTAVYGTIQANGMVFGGYLGGGGQVVIGAGGATVETVFAGTTLAFGQAGTLTLAGGPAAMAGTLAGFARGDAIDVAHVVLGSAAVAGGLVLRDGSGTVIGTIALQNAAALAGAGVAVRADGAGGTLVSLAAAPTTARALTWVGSASGLWSDPAAWQSGGLAAGFSPGSLDTVTIAAANPTLLSGPGAAASASLSGRVSLAGAYQFGGLAVGTLGGQDATVAVATTLSVSGGITLDGASCIEVGASPVAWGGWVKVFAGGTLSGSGTIAANTAVYGTILANGMVFGGYLGGGGQVVIGGGGATVGTVFSETTLVFAPGGTLAIAAGSAASVAGTLAGFAAGDAIDFVGMAAAGALVSGGGLVVRDAAGHVLSTLNLQNAASLAGSGFVVQGDGAGGSLVSLAVATGPRTLSWVGGSGLWGNALGWQVGGAQAAIAPGSLDMVSVAAASPLVLTGPGSAAGATFSGNVTLAGVYRFGSLAVGNLGGQGAVVAVATSLSVTAGITLDGGSCVEVGANPVAWGGWVKVFAGGTLSGSGTIAANTAVYGTILASGMVFGGYLGGGGQVVIGAAGATVGTVFAETTLAFAQGGTLIIAAGSAGAVAGTLAGFAAGDAIDLSGVAAGSAVVSGGALVVRDAAGHVAASLALQNAATLAGTNFVVQSDNSGGSLVSFAAAAGQRSLAWVGASGVWGDARGWQVAGQAAASAPAALDLVSVAAATPIVVTGPGAAASATLSGSVTFAGAYRFGSLTAGALGGQGATVAVATTLSVTGGIVLDGNSCIGVGANPVAWGGWVKVFAGGTLSGSGTIAANTAVYGKIQANGMVFAGYLGGSGQVVIGAGGATVGTVFSETTLVFGQVGTLTVSGAGMSGTLAGFATGNAIDLTGAAANSAVLSGGTLAVRDAAGRLLASLAMQDPATYAGATFVVQGDGAGGSVVRLGAAAVGAGHVLSWVTAGGAWANAANWQDSATGSAATPGSLDAVAIMGGTLPMAITGSGAVASVAVSRSVLLDGAFQAGTVNVTGTLGLAGGGPDLFGAISQAGAASPSVIAVAGSTVTVRGMVDAGAVTVTAAAELRIGTTLSVSAGVTLDAGSGVELGGSPVFRAGWLGVFAGGTLIGSGGVAANVAVYDTAISQGLRFGGSLGGTGRVLIEAAGASVGTVAGGLTLAFDAPGAVLTVGAGSPTAMAGTLSGFAAGDAIDLTGVAVSGAVLSAGTLSLLAPSGAALGAWSLRNTTASSALVLPDGSGGSLVVALAAVATTQVAASGGTARNLTWSGPSGGAWNSAASWGGAAPPGSLDVAVLTGSAVPMVVTGAGAAARVAVAGAVLLDGAFQAGSVNVAGSLTLAGGAQLQAAGIGQDGAATPSVLAVVGSTLGVSGTLDAGALSATSGASVQVGTTLSVSRGLGVDASSGIAVGGAATAGVVRVFAGGTLIGTGAVAGNAVVDGTAISQGLRFGGSLGGTGRVLIEAAGASVGTVAGGLTLAFDAPGAVLTVGAGSPTAMAGTLSGFAAGDAIDLTGVAVSGAVLSAGTLSLLAPSGAALGAWSLRNTTASSALVLPDGSGGSLVVALAAVATTQVAASGGTARNLTWSGPSGGAWNSAASWGGAAPPGSLDVAVLTGSAVPMVVTGAGAAARVAVAGAVLLDGAFQAGSVNVAGSLTLAGGAQLQAAGIGQDGAATPSVLAVVGSTLGVSGTLDAGALSATGGASVQVGTTLSVSRGLGVDASSGIAVGGAATAGVVRVFAGGTLIGTGAVAGNAIVDDTAISQGLRFGGSLGGTGRVLIEAAGASVGTVAGGLTLAFDAPGAVLTVGAGSPTAMAGTLSGFSGGDGIDLANGVAGSASYAATGSLDGTLSVYDLLGGLLGQFALYGDSDAYAAATFSVLPDAVGTMVREVPSGGFQISVRHPS